jgi:hypothetical protein
MTDTRQKRGAAINVGAPVPLVLPDADGTIDAADRAVLGQAYPLDMAPSPEYPTTIAASRRIRLPLGGIWLVDPDAPEFCEIDWRGLLSAGVTLVSVGYVLPPGSRLLDQPIDNAGRSAIRVSGLTHAALFDIQCTALFSNGVTSLFVAPLRGFNS